MTKGQMKKGQKTRRMALRAVALAAPLAAVMLAGCRDNQYLDRRDTIRLGAGDAVAHNRAVHTVDPWPVYSKDRNIAVDGKRMMVGIKRYQENNSIEPEGAETSDNYKAPEDPDSGPGGGSSK